MKYTYLQAQDADGRMVSPGVETERVDLFVVFEGEVDWSGGPVGEAAAPGVGEQIWAEHQNEPYGPGESRPLAHAIRSMVVGDVIVLHDGPSESGLDEMSLVLIVDRFGFVQAEATAAEFIRRIAQRGVPARGHVNGGYYYASFERQDVDAA